MPNQVCPNCNFKNQTDNDFCQECGCPLDLSKYIESKKLDKSFSDKVKSIFGNKRTDEINDEIEKFIRLSQNFNDYENDLVDLKSYSYDKTKFKEKYSKISELDNFNYLDEINNDEDLNRKLLLLKSVKTFINNWDVEIEKIDKLLFDINSKTKDIDIFYKDLDDLLNSDFELQINHKNNLIQTHKLTFDFFDRPKVKELTINSKDKIKEFLNNYENIDELFKKHNIELKTKQHEELISKSSEKTTQFISKIEKLNKTEDIIPYKHINKLKSEFKKDYDILEKEDLSKLNIPTQTKSNISKFLTTYENTDELFKKHNDQIKAKQHEELISKSSEKITQFISKIEKLNKTEDLIPFKVVDEIKEEFQNDYDILKDEDLSKLNIPTQSKSNISKFLNDFNNLNKIVDKINEDLSIKILQEKLESNIDVLNKFNDELSNLMDSNFYITFKQKDRLKDKYKELSNLVHEASQKMDLPSEFKKFLKTYTNLDELVKYRNEKYVENELMEHENFFDNIDGKSLDTNQRLAVVKNELNSQIIAGAGCGKTLTINAKVRYLIEKKGVNPNEILCLSFSNASVKDLKEKLPIGVEITTFHKLGGSILKANNKPSRVDDTAMNDYVKEYFKNHVINNEKLCEEIFDLYSYYLYTPIDENQASSIGELYDLEEGREFKTLKELYGGDKNKTTFNNTTVKSLEELIISNYLFAHQIDYEYEKIFKTNNKYFLSQKEFIYNLLFSEFDEIDYYPEVIDDLLRNILDLCEIKNEIILNDYSPDFYLKENNIYLEHFGVNKDCEVLWLEEKEAEKYKQSIYWKRELHKNYGSKLLETYSYYTSENRLLQRLEEKLKKAGVEIKEIDYQYMFSKIVERDNVNKFKDFMKLITNFVQLFKSNGYTIDKFDEFKQKNENNEDEFDKKRTELFLDIAEDVYIAYENHLKEISKIDFNDMINNATNEVKKGNLNKNYRYILIDEYQDTSYTRYNLVKEIQNKTGAKVCVVGDDWQSIYRFTGCDISLFSKFEDFFKNPEKLTIETTYRNSQELIDISGRFIMKNPNQIKKSLISKKESTPKPVKIAYYNKSSTESKIKTMELIIDKISKKSNDIMILGRNNFDIKDFIEGDLFKRRYKNDSKLIYTKNEDLNINFISVHKSKGLEKDNVILINLENSINGFPNQMIDDPLMNFVIKDSDVYPHGEERRLFYVALTRTKNNTYLLVPETEKSEFVLELEENMNDLEIISKNSLEEESIDDINEFMGNKNVHSIKTKLKCPICKTGDVILKIIKKKNGNAIVKFFECSHRRCDWDGGYYNSDLELLDEIEICSQCESVMQVKDGKYGPFHTCPNNCKTPKLTEDKLKRVNQIIKKMDSKIEFETHKTNIDCPECSDGKVTLRINPNNKQKRFVCSNKKCNWDGGTTTIQKSDLDKIKICPDCGGILILRNSKRGKFYGCSNFPKCKFTKNENETNINFKPSDNIKTKLKCPKCKKGDVLLKNKKFICSQCNWDGGTFNQDKEKLNTIEYCEAPNCQGITYLRKGQYGEFRTCSNYFKTKCKGKSEKNQAKSFKKQKSSSKWKKIDTDLTCPSCDDGDVILLKNTETEKGFFKCTNNDCDWNGGSFNKSEDVLDTLDYCPEDDCEGLIYEIEGKYGPFNVCTYFSKTKCKAGRK